VNAHIRALFILPDPNAALAYLPDVILAAEVIERETQEAAAKEKERFIDWRTRNNVPEAAGGRLDTCFATWTEQIGEIEAVVTHSGRLSDLIVVLRPAPGSVQAQRCFDAAVFESGHPTLVIGEKLPFEHATGTALVSAAAEQQATLIVLRTYHRVRSNPRLCSLFPGRP
jgi:hypothetical protein